MSDRGIKNSQPGSEGPALTRELKRTPWFQVAIWHSLALIIMVLMMLGQPILALGFLILAALLSAIRVFSLAFGRKSRLIPVAHKSLRRAVRHTLPKRIAALKKEVAFWAKRTLRLLRRNLIPHRVSYGLLLMFVFWAALNVSVVFAFAATTTLIVLPVSLRLANKMVRRANTQSLLRELLPPRYVDAVPPEPFESAPRLGPYVRMSPSAKRRKTSTSPSMSIIRILGNDLPPRHKDGQTLLNLEFLLRHEPEFPDATKGIVLNRIVDSGRREVLRRMAEKAGFTVSDIAFDPDAYRALPLDFDCLPYPAFLESREFAELPRGVQLSALNAVFRFKNAYAINNNGARNIAIGVGLADSEWALPLDGNVFLPANGWESLTAGIIQHPKPKYWILPMRRLNTNQDVYRKRRVGQAWEEPQVAFGQQSSERFREDLPYGRRPKVDLLWKLGVPGPWQELKQLPWDQPYPDKSADFGQYGTAGEVLRLHSGKRNLESGRKRSAVASKRNLARDEARLGYLVSLEKHFGIRDDSHELLVRLSDRVLDSVSRVGVGTESVLVS